MRYQAVPEGISRVGFGSCDFGHHHLFVVRTHTGEKTSHMPSNCLLWFWHNDLPNEDAVVVDDERNIVGQFGRTKSRTCWVFFCSFDVSE